MHVIFCVSELAFLTSFIVILATLGLLQWSLETLEGSEIALPTC